MTTATCKYCEHRGQLGNTVRYERIVENGKEISVPICSKCISEITVIRRPK